MQITKINYVIPCICFIFSALSAIGQRSGILIHTDNCNHLIAGVDNYVHVVSVKGYPVSEDQIEAWLYTPYHYDNNLGPVQIEIKKEGTGFRVHPDSMGLIEFKVNLNGKIETAKTGVKPIEAVIRLSKYGANSEKKPSAPEMRMQRGLGAYVECCGFNAVCVVTEFEIIRIGNDHSVAKTGNTGARFETAGLQIIQQASKGDLYIFRNIYYRCPGGEKQRGEDIIVEVR